MQLWLVAAPPERLNVITCAAPPPVCVMETPRRGSHVCAFPRQLNARGILFTCTSVPPQTPKGRQRNFQIARGTVCTTVQRSRFSLLNMLLTLYLTLCHSFCISLCISLCISRYFSRFVSHFVSHCMSLILYLTFCHSLCISMMSLTLYLILCLTCMSL